MLTKYRSAAIHKTMKTKILLFALVALLVPALGLAQNATIVQTQSNSWNIAHNFELLSTGQNGGVYADTHLGVTVSRYTGLLDLTRVVIKVLQPATSVSPTINASLAIESGASTTFTNNSGNKVTETTLLYASDSSIYTALTSLGASINDYTSLKSTTTYSNLTLTNPATIAKTINITQSSATIFDSNDYTLTSADLNSIFRDGTDISFGSTDPSGSSIVDTNFGYNRNNTSVLTATITGTNSGKVSIEFYAVPEPTTVGLLLGAGGLGVVAAVRRRRAKA